MARKITFTRAEMAAVSSVLDGNPDPDIRAIESLYRKMEEASEPAVAPLPFAPRQFTEALTEAGVNATWVDTPAFWARLTNAIRGCGMTLDDVRELAASMTWVKGAISAITVAQNGAEWLARARAEKRTSSTAPRPAGLWDEGT